MRRPVFRMAFVASFLATLGATAACSYIFQDTLPSVAALTTGIDAGFDVGIEDAPFVIPPFDGPAAPVAFCADQTVPFLYCEDFDEAQTPTVDSIGTTRAAAGGTIEVVNVVSLSAPRSLLATASVVEAGPTPALAAVDHVLNQNPDGATLSFSMLVNQWDSTSTQIAALGVAATAGPCTIRVGGNATTWVLKQTCGATELVTDSGKAITTKAWIHFALAIQNTPTSLVTLDIDGTRVASVAGIAGLDRGPLSVTLGLDNIVDGNVTVFEDNVLVTSP